VEKWAEAISQEHGFREVGHSVELFGLCQSC
jgi:Fur family ferric uptake transcriptional regulator